MDVNKLLADCFALLPVVYQFVSQAGLSRFLPAPSVVINGRKFVLVKKVRRAISRFAADVLVCARPPAVARLTPENKPRRRLGRAATRRCTSRRRSAA